MDTFFDTPCMTQLSQYSATIHICRMYVHVRRTRYTLLHNERLLNMIFYFAK